MPATSGRAKMFFSEIFQIERDALDAHGAMDVSLVTDLPLFVDPFLLYCSPKKQYNDLHLSMIEYLCFLKDRAGIRTSARKG